MASKKKSTNEPEPRKAIRKPIILGGDLSHPADVPLVEAGPLYAAFEALTGVDPRDSVAMARPGVRQALNVFSLSIASVVSPNPRLDAWLARVPSIVTGYDARRVAALGFIESRLAVGIRDVRGSCVELDSRFASLTDQQEASALKHLKSKRHIAPVAARLSLACGAFDDTRIVGESLEAAVARIAKSYRAAAARGRKAH
jgi:hypothetical protein